MYCLEKMGFYLKRKHYLKVRIADVQEILQIKTGSQVIKKLKARYGLNYNESVIPASVFAEHYAIIATTIAIISAINSNLSKFSSLILAFSFLITYNLGD